MDRVEAHMRRSPGGVFEPALPDVEEPENPTTDLPPTALESFHDEVLAKMEELRRNTRGADQSLICTHWFEEDERQADLESERYRKALRRLDS